MLCVVESLKKLCIFIKIGRATRITTIYKNMNTKIEHKGKNMHWHQTFIFPKIRHIRYSNYAQSILHDFSWGKILIFWKNERSRRKKISGKIYTFFIFFPKKCFRNFSKLFFFHWQKYLWLIFRRNLIFVIPSCWKSRLWFY